MFILGTALVLGASIANALGLNLTALVRHRALARRSHVMTSSQRITSGSLAFRGISGEPSTLARYGCSA
jgi:hypothetical protein